MANNVQFGRYAEVEIRDFNSQTKTVIGNEFEIDFEYFKTVDQTKEDDSGVIRIYGLTDERVKSLQTEGGEVRLRCGYMGSQIDTLIIASISSLYSEKVNNTSMMTINCSANLMNHYITESFSNNGGALSILGLLANIAKSMGYQNVDVDLSSVSNDDLKKVEDYLNTAKTNFSVVGSLAESLKTLTEQIGFSWRKVSGVKVVITPTNEGIKRILNLTKSGYAKVESLKKSTSINFLSTLEADTLDTVAVVLDYQTGLISSNKEYKISYAYADQIVDEDSGIVTPSGVGISKPKNQPTEDDNPTVSNSYLSGLKIKDSSATNNGGVKKHTAEFANIVSSYFGYGVIRYFSSFNDSFHVKTGGRHPKGEAFDFTLVNGSLSNAAKVTQEVRDLASDHGYSVKMLDEYNYPSKGSTGGHIHVSVYGVGDSSNYNPKYSKSSSKALKRRISVATNLEYRRVKALLNPLVLPQTNIAVLEGVVETDREKFAFKDSNLDKEGVTEAMYKLCRVRSASFSGNNKQGDWLMELYCEDTESMRADEKQTAAILANNPSENIDIVEATEPKKPKKKKKDKKITDEGDE